MSKPFLVVSVRVLEARSLQSRNNTVCCLWRQEQVNVNCGQAPPPMCLLPVYLTSPHVTRSPRPSPLYLYTASNQILGLHENKANTKLWLQSVLEYWMLKLAGSGWSISIRLQCWWRAFDLQFHLFCSCVSAYYVNYTGTVYHFLQFEIPTITTAELSIFQTSIYLSASDTIPHWHGAEFEAVSNHHDRFQYWHMDSTTIAL